MSKMTEARRSLVSVSGTPYYRCVSRCVRRAFLCGEDDYSGKSFEYRRVWSIDRLTTSNEMYYIDVCSDAVMRKTLPFNAISQC